jgi:hypothetical protein
MQFSQHKIARDFAPHFFSCKQKMAEKTEQTNGAFSMCLNVKDVHASKAF